MQWTQSHLFALNIWSSSDPESAHWGGPKARFLISSGAHSFVEEIAGFRAMMEKL
jgi:hypothetical protein